MYYDTELLLALSSTAITGLLSTYLTSPAIFNGTVPQDFTDMNFINFYFISLPDKENHIMKYSVDCRGESYAEANTIANAVYTALNRVSFSNFFTSCDIGQTLPPMDNTDVYNTPVSVNLFKRV